MLDEGESTVQDSGFDLKIMGCRRCASRHLVRQRRRHDLPVYILSLLCPFRIYKCHECNYENYIFYSFARLYSALGVVVLLGVWSFVASLDYPLSSLFSNRINRNSFSLDSELEPVLTENRREKRKHIMEEVSWPSLRAGNGSSTGSVQRKAQSNIDTRIPSITVAEDGVGIKSDNNTPIQNKDQESTEPSNKRQGPKLTFLSEEEYRQLLESRIDEKALTGMSDLSFVGIRLTADPAPEDRSEGAMRFDSFRRDI